MIYLGNNNLATNILKVYIGVEGKARKILKAYLGVEGKAKLVYSLTPLIKIWSWGFNGEEVDATWFDGLNNYLATNSGSSLTTDDGQPILGTTKSVTLSEAVLGTTTHLIRVIGVDQDADNTVTFLTKNCLSQYTVFSPSSAVWIGSTARSLCQSYYNAFPGKDAIKTVSKGTCPNISTESSRSDAVTYNDETVWLPSEREMGLDKSSPLSVANSTTSNAECTQGKNFSYTYYTSNTNRIMYLGDTSTSRYGCPWERSRSYNDSSSVCGVSLNGSARYSDHDTRDGFAPAFVIGNNSDGGATEPDIPVEYHTLADLPVGTKVRLAYDTNDDWGAVGDIGLYTVVHQGRPGADSEYETVLNWYDESCDGTWVLADIVQYTNGGSIQSAWIPTDVTWTNSAWAYYLNEYLGIISVPETTLSETTQAAIKEVQLPVLTTDMASKIDEPTKIFILSAGELGIYQDASGNYVTTDPAGIWLDYFANATNDTRITNYQYATRTPTTDGQIYFINQEGVLTKGDDTFSTIDHIVVLHRPAMILDSSAEVALYDEGVYEIVSSL